MTALGDARTVVDGLKTLGLPVAILIFVALIFTGYAPSPFLTVQQQMAVSLALHRARTEEFYRESVRLARVNCLNIAKLAKGIETECLPLLQDETMAPGVER